jgi:hypothetical protein
VSFSRTLILVSVLVSGCIPELYSDGATSDVFAASASDYEAPENQWDQCELPPASLQSDGFGEGETFPDLRMMDQHGAEVSMWQWYGCVVAVDISTMWCGPCRQIAKEVDHTWKDYRDQGFVYVTMLPENSTGDVPTKSDLNAWANAGNITAPVLQDAEGYSYDLAPDGAFPRILIIGRDMTIENSQVTPEDAAIRAAIESAL